MSHRNPLRVVLINHSDTLGGASVVTNRLMRTLCANGVDAGMLVNTRTTDAERISLISSRYMRGVRFMVEAVSGLVSNGFDRKHLFEISTACSGYDVTRHPSVRDADVICVNWVNQGMMSLDGLRKLASLGKPIVWTMHDMWPMTGVCHHAHSCERYKEGCGNCPLLTWRSSPRDKSWRVSRQKHKIYERGNFTFVGVSNWIAERARESWLLHDRRVEVIPNAFPVDFYNPHPAQHIPMFHIDFTKHLIMMGAARLDDPVKGLDYAIKALNHVCDTQPKIADTSLAVFFGDLRNPDALADLRFPYRYIGKINDAKILRHLYASSSVVLSSSLVETLPGTLIEGQASGAVPVSFDNGGQCDIIDHKVSGYLAKVGDYEDLARGIVWAIENPIDRDYLHGEVARKFNGDLIAKSYIELFDRLV